MSVWYALTLGVLCIWTIGFIVFFRKRLSCMAGMMAAMALGMMVGLGFGVLVASWMPGQLFQSTVLGMLIGGLIGAFAGLPISIMAVLDGLLSGIMGGMMGTMLISMIPSSYSIPTLKIVALLCCGVIFLVLLMLQGEIKPDYLKTHSWLFSKPAPMFAVIVVLLTVSNLSSVPQSTMGVGEHAHQDPIAQHLQTPDLNQKIVIVAKEFTFSLQNLSVIAGEPFQLILQNTGEVEHDFEIVGTNVHIHAGPDKIASQIVTLNKPGTYQAICTLPGHQEAGMVAVVHVNPR
ncbi:cupredoxin domain-containing protein [Paenibacillus antri]|nr:cupredoxin domain-containing protein [Paenibacillus antri]